MTAGDSSSSSGFVHGGPIAIASGTGLTLLDSDLAQLGTTTTVTGTLSAANGVEVGSGDTLQGSGTVNAAVTALNGGTVAPGSSTGILNTGNVGGMERGQKIKVRDSVKIIEMIAKDKISWQHDDYWGYEVPTDIPGVELERFQPENYYSQDQMERLSAELKEQRVDWLSQFPQLDEGILKAVKE